MNLAFLNFDRINGLVVDIADTLKRKHFRDKNTKTGSVLERGKILLFELESDLQNRRERENKGDYNQMEFQCTKKGF